RKSVIVEVAVLHGAEDIGEGGHDNWTLEWDAAVWRSTSRRQSHAQFGEEYFRRVCVAWIDHLQSQGRVGGVARGVSCDRSDFNLTGLVEGDRGAPGAVQSCLFASDR